MGFSEFQHLTHEIGTAILVLLYVLRLIVLFRRRLAQDISSNAKGEIWQGTVDAFVVVVEPGRRSIQTAHSIHALAGDLGIKRVYAVGNKVASESDKAFIREQLPAFEILGMLPTDAQAMEADRRGLAVFSHAPQLADRAREIADRLTAQSAQE